MKCKIWSKRSNSSSWYWVRSDWLSDEANEVVSVLFNVFIAWILVMFNYICLVICTGSTLGYDFVFSTKLPFVRPHCGSSRGKGKTSFDRDHRLMNTSTLETSA